MNRGQSFSKVKYEEKILHELNSLLRTEASDPRVQFVTLTHVELNKDYSMAKVFWDTFDPKKRGDCKKAIEGMGPRLRSLLAKTLNVRHTPSLEFIYNSQFEDAQNIEKLLDADKSEDEE